MTWKEYIWKSGFIKITSHQKWCRVKSLAGSRETFAFETNITKISCLSYVACVAYVLINIACVADSLNPPIRKSDTVAASRHPSIGSKGRNDHLEQITIAFVFIGNTLTQLWCSRHHCTRRQLQS